MIKQGLLALGARPEPLDMKDVIGSLQSEMLAGVECSLEEILSFRNSSNIDEFHWNEGMFYAVPDVLVVSKSWFDSLSPQMQDMLWNASRHAVNQQREYWMEEVEYMMNTLESQGTTGDEEHTEQFRQAVHHLQGQTAESFGEEFAAALRAILSVK